MWTQLDVYKRQGQDAVTSAGVLAEDDVAALLAANPAAVLSHVFVDVLVAHGGDVYKRQA